MTSAWSQHLYSYTGNNPVNYVDPTGHWPEWNNLFNGTAWVVNGAMIVAVGLLTAEKICMKMAEYQIEHVYKQLDTKK